MWLARPLLFEKEFFRRTHLGHTGTLCGGAFAACGVSTCHQADKEHMFSTIPQKSNATQNWPMIYAQLWNLSN